MAHPLLRRGPGGAPPPRGRAPAWACTTPSGSPPSTAASWWPRAARTAATCLVASLPIVVPTSVPARNNPGYDNLGGYSPVLIELSDVLPWQAFVPKENAEERSDWEKTDPPRPERPADGGSLFCEMSLLQDGQSMWPWKRGPTRWFSGAWARKSVAPTCLWELQWQNRGKILGVPLANQGLNPEEGSEPGALCRHDAVCHGDEHWGGDHHGCG